MANETKETPSPSSGSASTIAQTRRDLQELSDPRKLKAWLRATRATRAAMERDLDAWFERS